MKVLACVGEQIHHSQNVSLVCGLFQTENNQSLKDSWRTFDLLSICLKIVDRGQFWEGHLTVGNYSMN